MTKSEKFIFLVQSAFLADVASNKLNGSPAIETLFYMGEAVRVSECIPTELEALDAGEEFCRHMLPSLKDPKAECPGWMMQG